MNQGYFKTDYKYFTLLEKDYLKLEIIDIYDLMIMLSVSQCL